MMRRRPLVMLLARGDRRARLPCDDDGGPGRRCGRDRGRRSDAGADETSTPRTTGTRRRSPETITGTVPLAFDLAVDGRGCRSVTAATFTRSAGLVTIGRDLRALAYERTD